MNKISNIPIFLSNNVCTAPVTDPPHAAQMHLNVEKMFSYQKKKKRAREVDVYDITSCFTEMQYVEYILKQVKEIEENDQPY